MPPLDLDALRQKIDKQRSRVRQALANMAITGDSDHLWQQDERALTQAIMALDELAEARRTLQWQPINTAPKDGTPIIMFVKRHGVQYWFAAHWLQCDDGSSGWIGSSFWSQPEGNWTTVMGEDVTHWRPLPAPPED